jgi:hypothetical protein
MRDSYLTAKAQGRLTWEEWRSDDR